MFKIFQQQPITVGRQTSLNIRYTHEDQPLGKDASIRIGYNFGDGAGRVQSENRDEPNYMEITSSANCKLELQSAQRRRSITHYAGTGLSDLYIFEINVASAVLNPGNTIDITIAGFIAGKCCDSPLEFFYHIDPSNSYPLGNHHPNAPHYSQYLSADGKSFPEWKSCGIKVSLLPEKPAYADIVLPSIIETGKSIQMRVVIYDRLFNHIKNFQSPLKLTSENTPGLNFAKETFSTGPDGYALLPITFNRPLVNIKLEFHIPSLGNFKTNPIKVVDAKAAKKVLWGELHGHSALSDGGCRGADDFFQYAMNIRGLDFAALADHSYGLAVKDHWGTLLKAIEKNSFDDNFIAILGYEIMTDGFGHRNIYFPGLKAKLLMADYQPGCGGSFVGEDIEAYKDIWNPDVPKVHDVKDIIAAFNEDEFLWTGHHYCIAPEDRQHLKLYEASSEWGRSHEGYCENSSTTKLNDLFVQGLSPGLTGGSDDHRAKAGFMGNNTVGGPLRYPSGLTAVITKSLDRSNIYNALRNKHCYATTGARILLDIKADYSDTKLDVNLDIAGTDILDTVLVFKNGEEVHRTFIDTGYNGLLDWEDANFTKEDNCYICIWQTDGQQAWINPLPFC